MILNFGPPTLRVVSDGVPQLRRGEPALAEVVNHQQVIDDLRSGDANEYG